MAKLIKRIGTKAYKFSVEIYLKKLELNLDFGQEKTKCLLIYNRGDQKTEIKTPVPLINGKAIFSDIIKQQSTLYYSKKKSLYLEKIAQIDVLLINSDSNKKLIGFVKIDLSKYPNNQQKS